MSDLKALLDRADRAVAHVPLPADGLEGLQRRRDRKRRNQRIAAGVVGIAVFVAAVWIVTSVGSSDRTQTPAVPGGTETGPATPPAGTGPETFLIDLNTGEMTRLPESIAGVGYSVSPDGTMVAYTSGGQFFIASPDGTDVQQVMHDRRVRGELDWSPDGEAIAFSRVSGEFQNIFVLDLATGETSQVTNEKPPTETNIEYTGVGVGAFSPQFSPDGASIVYSVNRGDGFSVRSVPVTGGKSTLLVGAGKNDVEAWQPTFSPDGSLAVACSGRLEGICIANADGTNLRELVSDPSLFGPRWSPDGTRIAYLNQENYPDNRVFVVDLATGETTFVAQGTAIDWLDDHTLIVLHYP
jgi:Tol biopolymer transport system component